MKMRMLMRLREVLTPATAALLPRFISDSASRVDALSLGAFTQWSITGGSPKHAPAPPSFFAVQNGSLTSTKSESELSCTWRGMRLPGAFHLIGASAGRAEYEKLQERFAQHAPTGMLCLCCCQS